MVRERFDGVCEAFEEGHARVRVESSGGEKATAFIALNKFSEEQRRVLCVGSAVLVTILDRCWDIQVSN